MTNAPLLYTNASWAPLLLRLTAPVKALPLCVSTMLPVLPAAKLAVPGTVKAAVWVMPPAAVTLRLPLLVRVRPGSAIGPPNFSVRLRRLDNDVRLPGSTAPALVFHRLTSRMLPSVPPNDSAADPKSLA